MAQGWRRKAMKACCAGWVREILISIVLLLALEGSGYAMDVTIGWDASSGTGVAGYAVYYGTASGNYAPSSGDYATQGAPPISVGPGVTQITLTGLNDNKDYFFAVQAFDSEGLYSLYSREVKVIAPSSITAQYAQYDRGWEITSGDLAGFTVLYNSADGITPTLGSSDTIPALNLPGLTAVGIPLNLEPNGSVFNTPVTLIFPCPGYSYISDFSLGLFEGGQWQLVWDGGTQELTTAGTDWIDGLPQYLPNENPPTIKIAVKHFSGVQAGAPPAAAAAAQATGDAGGGGGGCFISTARGNKE
jgi:hypothetical protein